MLPLVAAASSMHYDVVVWLLSHGADPNGHAVMCYCAVNSTIAILQLLIDAGGDINRNSGVLGEPPLYAAMSADDSDDKVRALLAAPSLDFTAKYDGETPQQYARSGCNPEAADMMAQEVSSVAFSSG